MRLVSREEVVAEVFNRNLDPNLLKDTMITMAQFRFVEYFLGPFSVKITENPEQYSDFIQDFIKPVVSWGVLLNSFEQLTTQLTEKGAYQFVGDGVTIVGEQSRYNNKIEIKRNVYGLIKKMLDEASLLKSAGDERFSDFFRGKEPKLIAVNSNKKQQSRPY